MHAFSRKLTVPLIAASTLFFSVTVIRAGEVSKQKDQSTGWDVYTLQQGNTKVRVAPAAGANAFSIVHDGAEYLRVPEDLKKLPGVGFGVPILYPMPNRVRNAEFSFEGKTYTFPKNGRGHFIHGLVHGATFQVEKASSDNESATLKCSLKFANGGRHYELFPLEHIFRITLSVRENAVRWTYEIDNREGQSSVPFGVGLHPYFVYQNSREETFVKVPASTLMASADQLPSGKLLDLDEHPLDARTARSMKGYRADDVFFGMKTDLPASVEFRESMRRVTLVASSDFTHLVVWTPDRPYFGIENQTCSTDAHNLASNGQGDVAHLQICSPGKTKTGSVEYRFSRD